MRTFAILPAAGRGLRMGPSPLPKVLLSIGGTPMILRAIRTLTTAIGIDEVVIAAQPAETSLLAEALSSVSTTLPVRFVEGGVQRHQSVQRAFESLAADPDDIVLIHDADRPLIDVASVARAWEAAIAHGAAICAIRITDTLKEVDAAEQIVRTHPRERFHLAQTPQAFQYRLLARAYAASGGGSASDEALIAENAGIPVRVVRGSVRNIKIATPDDLLFAERLVADNRDLS